MSDKDIEYIAKHNTLKSCNAKKVWIYKQIKSIIESSRRNHDKLLAQSQIQAMIYFRNPDNAQAKVSAIEFGAQAEKECDFAGELKKLLESVRTTAIKK